MLQMGRFDEQATYEKEKAAEAGGVGGSTAPNAQMSDMSVNEQPVRNQPLHYFGTLYFVTCVSSHAGARPGPQLPGP